MVSATPARPDAPCVTLATDRQWPATSIGIGPWPSPEMPVEAHARFLRILERFRHSLAEQVSLWTPICTACGWRCSYCALRAGGITHGTLRWQLELARPNLVPHQLPAHRVTAEVLLLLWQ